MGTKIGVLKQNNENEKEDTPPPLPRVGSCIYATVSYTYFSFDDPTAMKWKDSSYNGILFRKIFKKLKFDLIKGEIEEEKKSELRIRVEIDRIQIRPAQKI